MKDFHLLLEKLTPASQILRKYLPLLFCLLLAVIYGLLAYRVQVLDNQQPSSDAITTQSQTIRVPRIDQTVLSQLKNLQDNSVSVQSLFNDARSNPFQE